MGFMTEVEIRQRAVKKEQSGDRKGQEGLPQSRIGLAGALLFV